VIIVLLQKAMDRLETVPAAGEALPLAGGKLRGLLDGGGDVSRSRSENFIEIEKIGVRHDEGESG
jgi:hypothetical protein